MQNKKKLITDCRFLARQYKNLHENVIWCALYESKNEPKSCSKQTHRIILMSIQCYLDVTYAGLMSKERWIPSGLRLEKPIFCMKRRTALSMALYIYIYIYSLFSSLAILSQGKDLQKAYSLIVKPQNQIYMLILNKLYW